MAKKQTVRGTKNTSKQVDPMVAAMLAGIVYRARLFNRQARMNVPEEAVVSEVIHLWRSVMDALGESSK
jgi:hypothetical protein